LKVKSTFLGSLSIKDKVKVKEVKDNRGVGLATTRQGKKVKLLIKL
jgi:putative ribosome biogenesis GTPase RsgA